MLTLGLSTYLRIAAVVAIAVGLFAFAVHERRVEKQEFAAAIRAANKTLQAKVDQQTKALQDAADKAAQDRNNAQNTLDAYMAAHPVGIVRLCPAPGAGRGNSPPAPDAGTSPASAGTGPAAVPEVPTGDVGGNLDIIVRAASVLAGLYQERQIIDAAH